MVLIRNLIYYSPRFLARSSEKFSLRTAFVASVLPYSFALHACLLLSIACFLNHMLLPGAFSELLENPTLSVFTEKMALDFCCIGSEIHTCIGLRCRMIIKLLICFLCAIKLGSSRWKADPYRLDLSLSLSFVPSLCRD